MTNHIHPKPDLLQPRIQEGEAAHYRDAGHWSKNVTFIHPPVKTSNTHSAPFANMTTLVETEARSRFPQFDKFSKAKRKKICEQIAHSTINRPDIHETAHLEPKFMEHLGLKTVIKDDLYRLTDDRYAPVEKWVDDFLANYDKDLTSLFPKLPQNILECLLDYQKNLREIFTNEQIYLRNVKQQSFLNEFGERIEVTLPIASSKDRSTSHLQNARLVKSGDKFLAVTGRPDTKQKALEQAEFLIRNNQAKDGHLYYVVNSYLNFNLEEQKGMFQKEIDVLKNLEGKTILVDDKYYTLHPLIFNTQLSFKTFEPFAPYDLSGKQASDQINSTNLKQLKEFVGNNNDPLIQNALAQLASPHLLAEEEMLLRAFICEKLDIPSVHHCASSKDRTTLGLAIAGALRKWIQLQELMGNDPFSNGNPLSLWKNENFKRLIAQEIPGCHQLSRNGLGTKGTILGKQLHDDDIGFKLNNGVAARILPMEYVKEASLPKKALMALVAACAWMLCTVIALARLLIFPIALYNPQAAKEGFLNIFRIHRFASLIPSKELNLDSPSIKDRHFLHKTGAAKPRFLLDLEKAPLDAIIQEMQLANPIANPQHRETLVLIANNWDRLKKLKTSKKLQKLMALCDKSPLTLFQLRKQFTTEFATKIKNLSTQETIPDSLQREAELGSIEKDGIYAQIEVDITKRGHNTLIEVIHKGQRTPIISENPSQIINRLSKFPFAQNGQVPLPIQALLTQTGKSLFAPYEQAIKVLSPDLLLMQKTQEMWDISLHVLDENTVQAKYRGPFKVISTLDAAEPLTDVSVEFSITLEKQSNENWVQTSYALDRISQKFNAKNALLFNTEIITGNHDQMIQTFLAADPAFKSRHTKKLLEVFDKNPAKYKPKLIQELEHLKKISPVASWEHYVASEDAQSCVELSKDQQKHLDSLSSDRKIGYLKEIMGTDWKRVKSRLPANYEDFIQDHNLKVTTNFLGRITDVKKSSDMTIIV